MMATGQPAFGMCVSSAGNEIRHGAGVMVLTMAPHGIAAVIRFDATVMASFGLPRKPSA